MFFIVMFTSKLIKTQHFTHYLEDGSSFSVVFITPYLMHDSVILWNRPLKVHIPIVHLGFNSQNGTISL